MARDELKEKVDRNVDELKTTVEAVYKRFEEEVTLFDRYLTQADVEDSQADFIESYLMMRESGLDFKDAFITAAEERSIELEEPEEDE